MAILPPADVMEKIIDINRRAAAKNATCGPLIKDVITLQACVVHIYKDLDIARCLDFKKFKCIINIDKLKRGKTL